MKQYNAENLVIHPQAGPDAGIIVEVTPEIAGWEHINFQARRLQPDQSWSFATGENELALVVLGGLLDVKSNRGTWEKIGGRENVFAGLPSALYLPRQTEFTVSASYGGCEFAVAWAKTTKDNEPRLVTPLDINTEIRGGDNATRQINQIIPPGFPCDRLVVVEVYTPSGNWSSYPPHKHDLHQAGSAGQVVEADLEEVYFYKIDKPEGYAFQRIYTDESSPLHRAGYPIDAVVLARNNEVVLIPEGYHPVTSAPGYTTYYLNVLAGSAQSLAASDDPAYAWVKQSYKSRDLRVPLYPVTKII